MPWCETVAKKKRLENVVGKTGASVLFFPDTDESLLTLSILSYFAFVVFTGSITAVIKGPSYVGALKYAAGNCRIYGNLVFGV